MSAIENLEQAARLQQKFNIWTIPDLIKHYEDTNRDDGSARAFFKPETMRFFKSRVSETLCFGKSCFYFVTSEKGPDNVRRYTVRQYNPDTIKIDTIGDFGAYGTMHEAKKACLQAALNDN